MAIYQTIDAFRASAESVIKQKSRRQKLSLYCEGLKAKSRQATLALRGLAQLKNHTDVNVTPTDPDEPKIQELVEFYCDTFWAFLYSCLDVLGQIINQAKKLGLDERQVSCKSVATSLQKKHGGSQEEAAFKKCMKSVAFKNLDRYRNCSIHRRQIYICTITHTVQHPSGYQSITTGDNLTVERILCDNPLVIKPRINQNRTVPEYMETTQERIFKHIEKILNCITTI